MDIDAEETVLRDTIEYPQLVKRVEVLERHEIIYLDVQVQELVYISKIAAEQLKIDLAADIVVGPELALQDGMI